MDVDNGVDMTPEEFKEKTGRDPDGRDLARVNCPIAGTPGHTTCGWCAKHDKPAFECLCVQPRSDV